MPLDKLDLRPEEAFRNLKVVLLDQIRTLEYHMGVAWKDLTSDCYSGEDQIDLELITKRLTDKYPADEEKEKKIKFNQLLYLKRCYYPLQNFIELYLEYKDATEGKEELLKKLMGLIKDDENGLRAIYRFFVAGSSYKTVPRSSLKEFAFLITILNESIKDEFGIDSHIRTPAYTTGELNAPYISKVLEREVIYEFNEQLKATFRELEDEVVRMLNIDIVRQRYGDTFGICSTWKQAKRRFHNNPMLVVSDLDNTQ